MPHINRVRLVNVKYNDAKSCYDNFIMNFGGKSATYDLQNGGGKSVMLLMLLQTVLPNTYLKADRPLKNIFKGGNQNRTSHCLVEWKLDDNSEYKYLLTGFCVRKRKEEEEEDRDTIGIEYFNYCYLYNTQNENDIKQIPLVEETNEGRIVMSYEKLKQYLTDMRKENLPVQVFHSKKEYLKYIEYFGLISAEWKLINEINSGENNIESYFKVNKTSRKLIENFLIKIIDNINMQNNSEVAENEDLAEALISIKDNLMKFKKESDHKKEYEETKELFEKLKRYAEEIETTYTKEEEIYQKAYETYYFYKDKKEKLQKQVENENSQIENYKRKYIELENQNSKLEINKKKMEQKNLFAQQEETRTKIESLQQKQEKIERQIKKAKAVNEYLEYKEKKDILEQKQIQIQKMYLSDEETQKQYNVYGTNYMRMVKRKKIEIEEQMNTAKLKKEQTNQKREEQKKQTSAANENYISIKTKLESLEKELNKKKEEEKGYQKELTSRGYLEELLNLEETINKFSERKQSLEKEEQRNITQIEELKADINGNEKKETEIKSEVIILKNSIENVNNQYEAYKNKKIEMEQLCKTFNVQTLEELQMNWQMKKENIKKSRLEKEIQKQIKQTKRDLIEKYHLAVPNEDIFFLKDKLKEKCAYVTTGIEELTKMEEERRTEILKTNPWYIYSVFIDEDSFVKFKTQGINYDIQSLVPVANIEFLRQKEENKEGKDFIYPIAKEIYQNMDEQRLESYKKELEDKILHLVRKIEQEEKEEEKLQTLIQDCKDFAEKYSKENVKKMENEIEKIENEIKEKEDFRKQLIKKKEQQEEIIENLKNRNSEIVALVSKLREDINWFNDLKQVKENIKNETKEQEKLKEEVQIAQEIFETKNEELEQLEVLLESYKEEERQIAYDLQAIENLLKDLEKFENLSNIEELPMEFDEIKNEYEALSKKLNSKNSQITELEESCKVLKEAMDKCQKRIEENGFLVSEFAESKENLSKTLDCVLEELKEDYDKTETEMHQYKEKENAYKQEISKIEGMISTLIKQLEEKGVFYKQEDEIETLENIEMQISENKQLIIVYENKRKELNEKVSTINKEIEKLSREIDKFESFIEQYPITRIEINLQNILETELYSYEKVTKRVRDLEESLRKLERSWENFIRYIKDKVRDFYIASDIYEIIQNIKFPEEKQETQRMKKGIEENISLIDEKIVHIEEALKSLAEYQEQFNGKCFEKAEVVVRDLNKLSGLSRIKIAGKETNIVKLELQEYERDEKQARIKAYIEAIVKEMEHNPELMDKVKLNEKLSSKALVAQVVNMDKASVKLYKIEDIAEHSGYKKWEDDLGSDGQVNALYFMFAVCIISYISMLTRPEALSNSKKVMIADNPFGATSAVYLWEGMFAMLKENNVQLIAPGHNISKELISKFEVNYILKAEYKGDNTKSIVVDRELRTEQEEANMNFEILKGNQESFFV